MKIEIEDAPKVEKTVTVMVTLLPSEAKKLLETIADGSFFKPYPEYLQYMMPTATPQASSAALRDQLVTALRTVSRR